MAVSMAAQLVVLMAELSGHSSVAQKVASRVALWAHWWVALMVHNLVDVKAVRTVCNLVE